MKNGGGGSFSFVAVVLDRHFKGYFSTSSYLTFIRTIRTMSSFLVKIFTNGCAPEGGETYPPFYIFSFKA